jgi:hypothetical protein
MIQKILLNQFGIKLNYYQITIIIFTIFIKNYIIQQLNNKLFYYNFFYIELF